MSAGNYIAIVKCPDGKYRGWMEFAPDYELFEHGGGTAEEFVKELLRPVNQHRCLFAASNRSAALAAASCIWTEYGERILNEAPPSVPEEDIEWTEHGRFMRDSDWAYMFQGEGTNDSTE